MTKTIVFVSEEIYRAYVRPAWAEKSRRKTRLKKERSLEMFLDLGYDIPLKEKSVDETVTDRLLIEELYSALEKLTSEEHFLIQAIYFSGKSERSYAKEIGLSNVAVHKQKHKILDKLRKFLKD